MRLWIDKCPLAGMICHWFGPWNLFKDCDHVLKAAIDTCNDKNSASGVLWGIAGGAANPCANTGSLVVT